MQQKSRTMLGVMDAIEQRRSVRSFQPATVDEPTVRALLRAAVLAPTARHLEPWAFVVVQDRDLLKRISDRAKAMSPEQSAHHEPDFNVFFDAGTLIVICVRPVGSSATADGWLAAENLMLAATELGLGTCCVGGAATEALNSPEIKAELAIPPDVEVVAPVVVGVPKAVPPPTGRKEPVILSWR